jgi:hypothetical protein
VIDPISLGINAILMSGTGTLGSAISAGLATFLTSKMLGASTRDSIKAGLLGGAGATATGKLGEYLSTAGTTVPLEGQIAAGGPGASVATSTPTGFGSDAVLTSAVGTAAPRFMPGTTGTGLSGQSSFVRNMLGDTSGLSNLLQDNRNLIGYGIGSSLIPQNIPPRVNPDIYGGMFTNMGGSAETYEQSRKDLEGLTKRAPVQDDPLTTDIYDYTPTNVLYRAEGGIAAFNEGGVNYLPSKTEHDEKDVNNYVRAQGYVEDGSGTGDKDTDTMLAQLADGEFVSRADAVLGAGIMAGASPEDFKEMRSKGAKFFYNQQDQLKRIFDIVNAN